MEGPHELARELVGAVSLTTGHLKNLPSWVDTLSATDAANLDECSKILALWPTAPPDTPFRTEDIKDTIKITTDIIKSHTATSELQPMHAVIDGLCTASNELFASGVPRADASVPEEHAKLCNSSLQTARKGWLEFLISRHQNDLRYYPFERQDDPVPEYSSRLDGESGDWNLGMISTRPDVCQTGRALCLRLATRLSELGFGTAELQRCISTPDESCREFIHLNMDMTALSTAFKTSLCQAKVDQTVARLCFSRAKHAASVAGTCPRAGHYALKEALDHESEAMAELSRLRCDTRAS